MVAGPMERGKPGGCWGYATGAMQVSENPALLGRCVNRGSQPPIDRRNLFRQFLIEGPFIFFFGNCPGVEDATGYPVRTRVTA
jgi:hypothetical protein